MVAPIFSRRRPGHKANRPGFPRERGGVQFRASFFTHGPHAAHPRGSPHLRRRPAGACVSQVLPHEVSLGTQLHAMCIRLNMPVAPAGHGHGDRAPPRDLIAQEGGIGQFIHKNMNIRVAGARQGGARETLRERHDATTRSPCPGRDDREVLELTRAKNISGVPVCRGRQGPWHTSPPGDRAIRDAYDAPVSS